MRTEKISNMEKETKSNIDRCIGFLQWQLSCPDLFSRPADDIHEDENHGAAGLRGADKPIIFGTEALLGKLQDGGTTRLALIFALRKECSKYEKLAAAWHNFFAKQRRQQAKANLTNAQHSIGAMCRILKGGASGRITRLYTSEAAGSTAKVAISNPLEIDRELQKNWSAITAGNFSEYQASRAGEAFVHKYYDYFARQ